MGALKRGCLEILIVWALAGAGLHYYFKGKFEPPGDLWGAVIGGMFLSWAWGLARNIYYTRVRLRLLQQAKRGMMPQDGKLFAAAGPIKPLQEAIRTPFQQTECVVYGYEISQKKTIRTGSGSGSSTRTVTNTYMGGYALCPCAVHTSVGNIKILGFPFPDQFPERTFGSQSCTNRILAYLAETKFEEKKGVGIKAIWSELKNVLAEDDGSHRYDWRTEHLEQRLEEDDLKVSEQCIPVGEQVCVIGPYSAAKGGLTNDLSRGGMEVFPGSLDAGIRAMRGRAIGYFSFALIFAFGGSFGSYGILTAREHRDPKVIEVNTNRLAEAIKSNDIEKARTALEHGAEKAFLNPNFDTSLREVSSPEMMGLLISHGFEPNLPLSNGHPLIISAVESENLQLLEALLRNDADVNVRQTGWGSTALEKAFDAGNGQFFRRLSEKGAVGIFANPTDATKIDSRGKDVFMRTIENYFTVHEQENAEEVKRLTDSWPEDFFESFKRGLYRGTRVCKPRFESGFVKGDVATVFLTCPTGHGPELWVYTLVSRGGVWKIRREAWDENNRWLTFAKGIAESPLREY